jgi:hypothetical protein
MTNTVISESLKEDLERFLKKNRKADLITTYLYFLEKKYNVHPVLFIREKTIYESQMISLRLEAQNKL